MLIFSLIGQKADAMAAAKEEFDRYLQNQSDLRNYTIWFNISENKALAAAIANNKLPSNSNK